MKKLCPLTERLLNVAQAVPKCSLLADIGTDHAYIPIYLVQKGIAERAVASDVVKGPAMRAERNIAEYGLSHKIKVQIADGLNCVYGADVIIIAGMGGKLICDILKQGMLAAKAAGTIVLQPMTAVYEVRKFLHSNGFVITKDTIAKEDDKLYNIITARKGHESYSQDIYYHIGKLTIDHNDPLLPEYIAKKVHSFDVMLENMANSQDIDVIIKRREIAELREQFLKAGEDIGIGK